MEGVEDEESSSSPSSYNFRTSSSVLYASMMSSSSTRRTSSRFSAADPSSTDSSVFSSSRSSSFSSEDDGNDILSTEGGLNLSFFTTTEIPIPALPTIISWTPPEVVNNETLSSSSTDCTLLDYDYDPTVSLISIACFIFGVYFCVFGFRCFKSVLFLTGFSFGLVVVFLICQVEELLPQYGNVGIAVLAGLLYGLICLLVPYVGFFTVGFHGGLLCGLAAMLFFPPGYSVWVTVIFLLGTGLFGAVANVCWPGLSIVTTSLIGGAGIVVSFDYFVEKLRMAKWVGQVGANSNGSGSVEDLCWFSWLLLGTWPVLLVVGILTQTLLTANGFSVEIYGYHDSKRAVPRRRLTREERALAKQAKYRYLYQVRTAGGDYISQAYIQFLQGKSSSGGPGADTLSTHMSTLQTSSQEESSIH